MSILALAPRPGVASIKSLWEMSEEKSRRFDMAKKKGSGEPLHQGVDRLPVDECRSEIIMRGFEVAGGSQESFAAYFLKEVEKLGKVIRATGAKRPSSAYPVFA